MGLTGHPFLNAPPQGLYPVSSGEIEAIGLYGDDKCRGAKWPASGPIRPQREKHLPKKHVRMTTASIGQLIGYRLPGGKGLLSIPKGYIWGQDCPASSYRLVIMSYYGGDREQLVDRLSRQTESARVLC